MYKLRLYYIAVVSILFFFSSACAKPSPTANATAGTINFTHTDIVIEGAVEDLVIEASVKVALCVTNPDFCLPYSLEIEEECENDPENNGDCCVAIASLNFKPEVFTQEFEQLREEFAKYKDRNGRRPLLPDDLEWIVKLNEQILQELFEEWYGPEFTATSDPWIACEKKKTKEEIKKMFETQVRRQYGKIFRLCLRQQECFPLTPAIVTPIVDFLWNVPSGTDTSERPLWVTPRPDDPFGTNCGWMYAPTMILPVCPQPRLMP